MITALRNFLAAKRMKFILPIAVALLGLGLTGCLTHKATTPLSQGYEEIVHPAHAWLTGNDTPRVSLQHHGAEDKITSIWPALYGVKEIVTNDLAIFVGELPYVDADGAKNIRPRLFAVKSPALPLDLTDEILWRWAKANGRNFALTLSRFSLVIPEEKAGQLELRLEFSSDNYLVTDDWPDVSELKLDWKQVSEIVRAVETKGVPQKDPRWQTPYIGEKF
jgi:hypothetical protein